MTDVRQTSRETYHAIISEGLLSDQRFRVYKALFSRGPCTAGELAVYMESVGEGQKETRHMVSRRLPELRDSKAAVERGERVCAVGGRNSIAWDVTANLPDQSLIRRVKRPDRERLLRAAVEIRQLLLYANVEDHPDTSATRELLAWLDGFSELR